MKLLFGLLMALILQASCEDIRKNLRGGGGGGAGQADYTSIARKIRSGPEESGTTCQDSGLAPVRIWRLSHTQYDNTVSALFKKPLSFSQNFPAQASENGFANGSDSARITQRLVEELDLASQEIVANIATLFPSISPCSNANSSACAQEFIESFGLKVFRQPLSSEQLSNYMGLYTLGQTTSSGLTGIQLVLRAMLQSPYFLFRQELGSLSAQPGRVQLTSYEIATQLAYGLWNTMPDDQLLQLAARNALLDRASVNAQIERMLEDPKARGGPRRFFGELFALNRLSSTDKDSNLFPEFATARSYLEEQTLTFVDHVVWESSGKLSEIFNANYTFLNAPVSGLYGLNNISGTEFRKVSLANDQRAGILTQPGFLALHSNFNQGSPILRGVYVRRNLLCQKLGDPPDDIDNTPPRPDTSSTTRQRFESATAAPLCQSCHVRINPIGFGLEQFDSSGRFRVSENGYPIDASGLLANTLDSDGPFNGAIELSAKLAKSSEVHSCISKRYFEFSFGRTSLPEESCSLENLSKKFFTGGGDIPELVRSVSQSDAFFMRQK